MMRVRWTTDAADDLERICDYIAESSPDSARRIAQLIVEGVGSLNTFPNRGRAAWKVLVSSRSLLCPSSLSTKYTKKWKYCESFTVRSNGLRVRS
jgi:plasmid stabilization system protein ParE